MTAVTLESPMVMTFDLLQRQPEHFTSTSSTGAAKFPCRVALVHPTAASLISLVAFCLS